MMYIYENTYNEVISFTPCAVDFQNQNANSIIMHVITTTTKNYIIIVFYARPKKYGLKFQV